MVGAALLFAVGCDERPTLRDSDGAALDERAVVADGAAHAPAVTPPPLGDGGLAVDASATEQPAPTSADAAVPALAGPARVLCLGDSITAQRESWIYPLQDLMRQDGCQYQLIGHDHEPYDGAYAQRSGYDDQRIAVGGFSSAGVLGWMQEQGLGGTPDVMISYLGVNNVYGGFIDGKYNPDVTGDPEGAYVADLTAMIAMARAANPQAVTILSEIQNGELPQISSAIAQVVAQQHRAASPVLVAKSASGVSTKDGIHTDEAGAATLAAKIYEVLGPVLQQRGGCR